MNNMEQRLEDVIKKQIKEDIDKTFTEYKNEKLKELDYEIEKRRNEIVGNVVNGIKIYIEERQQLSLEPAINIRIVNNVIRKV